MTSSFSTLASVRCAVLIVVLVMLRQCVSLADQIDKSILAESVLSKDERGVFLGVTISGERLSFLVDTGSSGTWIDKRHGNLCKTKMGSREVREATGGPKTVQTYLIEDVFIDKLRVANCEVAITDLSESQSKKRGRTVDGILGNNVLSQSVLQLDYDAGRVRILRDYQAEDQEHMDRISGFQGCPSVRVSLAGYTNVVIDTANEFGIILEPERFEEMRRRGLLQLQPKKTYLAKKQSEDRVLFFVKQVEFGGSICENVEGAATNYSTIGIDMLSRFRVTLDYPNRRLYLKAAADLKRDIPPDALGAVWIKDERGIIIDDLDKESPAYDAGLQIGDRLLRVNREAVEPKRLSEVRALFCESGKAIPIEIQRGKETYAKVITLHRTFPYPPIWPRKTTKLLD